MKSFYLSSLFLISFNILSAQDDPSSPPPPGVTVTYNACPINCTQEEFENALNPLLCDAIDDFEAETGEETTGSEKYRIFEVKNVSFPGAQDMYLTLLSPEDNDIWGKDMILMFQCAEGKYVEDAQRYYDNFSQAIDSMNATCTTLDSLATSTDLDIDFIKSTTWEGYISDDDWDGYVDLELDLKIIDSAYWIVLHIFMPDDY